MTVALTLWQPWASGVALGLKRWETRPIPPHGPWPAAKGYRRMPGCPVEPGELVLVHAAASATGLTWLDRADDPAAGVMRTQLFAEGYGTGDDLGDPALRPLPKLAVVATCTIELVLPIEAWWQGHEAVLNRTARWGLEWAQPIDSAPSDYRPTDIGDPEHGDGPWGDWTPGRWAYKLCDVRRLVSPVAASGRQGFWRPDSELIAQVEAAEQVWL